jgi:hypothetical protein
MTDDFLFRAYDARERLGRFQGAVMARRAMRVFRLHGWSEQGVAPLGGKRRLPGQGNGQRGKVPDHAKGLPPLFFFSTRQF